MKLRDKFQLKIQIVPLLSVLNAHVLIMNFDIMDFIDERFNAFLALDIKRKSLGVSEIDLRSRPIF